MSAAAVLQLQNKTPWGGLESAVARIVMKTVRECKIKMLSVISELDSAGLPVGEPERNETELDGSFHYAEGDGEVSEMRLTYREVGEGGSVDTEFEVGDGYAALTRKGAICSRMEFREGATCRSLYSIPPYSFDMAVTAKRLRIAMSKDGGRVDILYKMSIGGADKSARMKISVEPA